MTLNPLENIYTGTADNSSSTQKQVQIHDQTTIDAFVTGQMCDKEISSKHASAKDIAKEVVKLMKEMKVDEESEVTTLGTPMHIYPVAADLGEWKKIGNITELVSKVDCI